MNEPTALGVQLYSVRDDLGSRTSDTLSRLAGFGYTHVEPYDILTDPAALAEALDASGLAATAAHCRITEFDRDRVIGVARELGITTVIVPWVEPTSIADGAGVAELASRLNELSRYAAHQGVRIGYHNHEFEFAQTIDGLSVFETLVGLLDDDIVLEVDTYWASVGGADVFDLLPRLGARVRYLHVKNEPPDASDPPIRGVDITGRMAEVVDICRSFLEMPVVEVVVDDGDVFEALERNARFFRERVEA